MTTEHGGSFKQRLCAVCKKPIRYMGPGPNAYWRHLDNSPKVFADHIAKPGKVIMMRWIAIGHIVQGRMVPCEPMDVIEACEKALDKS